MIENLKLIAEFVTGLDRQQIGLLFLSISALLLVTLPLENWVKRR